MTSSYEPGSNEDPLRRNAGSPAVRVYDTIKRSVITEFGGVLSGFWGSIEEQVRLAALAGHDYGSNQDDRLAIVALQHRALELATRYRDAIEHEFERWVDPKPPRAADKSLSLMSEGELEIHLAGQQTVELLDHQFLHPLDLLDERLQALAGALGIEGKRDNPLRPEAAVGAFTALFGVDDLTPGLRTLVFRLHDKRLPHALGTIYERTNAALESAGFGGSSTTASAPRTRYVTRASPSQDRSQEGSQVASNGSRDDDAWVPDGGVVEAVAHPGQGHGGAPARGSGTSYAAQAAGAQSSAVGASGRPPRYRDVVRQQLHAWRARMTQASEQAAEQAATAGTSVDGQHVLATGELLSVARMLQGDDPAPFVRALGAGDARALAGVLREHLLEGVRQLGMDPTETTLSTDEEDAIDLVGILFRSLVEANELVARARGMYGKLVVPYLKVALVDDSLFNRRSHPARRMLDALTEACDGNSGETPQDSETLDRAERAVERVVSEYDDDLAIFELAAAELRDQLDQQRKRSDLAERRTAETIHGRERLQHARGAADDIVASRLADRPMTSAVARFLDGQWRHHLIQTWLRDGPDASKHRAAIALGDAMVQVDNDAAHARGSVVADQLIALQEPMADCYTSCGLDAGGARESMARIISALGLPDTSRMIHAPHSDDAPQAAEEETRPLRLVGGTDGLSFDPMIATRMRRLRVGQGLRLFDEDGQESAARVAWISPLTSRLLIVNRRGVRRMVVSPEELASLVGSGHVVVRSVDAPFDEAMKHLWQSLNAAPTAAKLTVTS